ncbi:MAG: ISKra4 family transposase [Candidatus Rokubacteria bacterium]|nr:ISKra4 family transposase [Candidatus Rokubacteria bacterium]MBI3105490.1 ISKra4 family transposase [Candidatus Rokubacteria bacterium]
MGRRRVGGPRGDLLRGRQKGGLKEAFDAAVVAEIEALVGPGAVDGLDFEAIETAARRRALTVAARAVEQRLNADGSDHRGPTFPCDCGTAARYAGRRPKTFTTALGDLMLGRAYYYCDACESGFCPRDRALGLQDASLSPAVTRMVGLAAAMVSFAESSELMRELGGVPVDAKQVERTAEALGREIAQDERTGGEPSPPPAPTMSLGLDGTGVPMRASELQGREGKQPDGSAKTREVKLVTVWTAEARDDDGTPVRDAGSVTYSAAIESAASRDTDEEVSEFAQRTAREARRRGFDAAARRAVLGDGALWIWNLADEQFPGALQIVDLFHVKHYLSDVAKDIYGAKSALGAQWATQRHDELDEGQIDAVLAALGLHAQANDEARKGLDYLTRNRHRMRYPDFRAQGLCTSSGVVEAGCKVAIGTRLKRAGMHWTVAGADAIIALRCCKLSGRFEDFWERRAAAPAGAR